MNIVQFAFHHPLLRLSAVAMAIHAIFSADVYAQTSREAIIPATIASEFLSQSVAIVGITPLPGLGQPLNEIAAPVQVARSADIMRSGALELSDFMNRNLGSVHVNTMQGNPFQMDVNYRGYAASPLLGTPQGLSVYMDGVRMNQPFGDVLSWDLIPRSAISSIALMPGSNPLFGMNTLGGALTIQTKDGNSHPGTSLQTTVGSNARRAFELEHGGSNDHGLDWYLTANLFKDRGWRDDSPSNVKQVFGKLGWQNANTEIKLSISHADNQLNGNGLQEQTLLEKNYSSVYTKPDITQNRSSMLNLTLNHSLHDQLQFSGNAYYRDIRSATFNGDVNQDSYDQSLYQLSNADKTALTAAGYTGFPASGATAANTPFPYWRCIAQTLQLDEPAEKCNGLINRTQTSQRNYGLSGQFNWQGELAGQRHQLIVGAAYDESSIGFTQSSQLGYLNSDHSITPVNAYGDGIHGGNVDGKPFDTRVDLQGNTKNWGVFLSDTISLTKDLHLTIAGRYNRSSISNRDQIHANNDSASLSGEHRFRRFNPALGLSYNPSQTMNIYAGYNQSSRAPSAIELGCANPDQPCKLPNAMAGDPPLKQIITRTIEAGVRGKIQENFQWNAGIFRAENQDDILFVADNQAGFGYFKNFGKTRRQGLELGLNGKLGKFNLGAQYTLLEATYQSTAIINSSGNSSNDSALAGQRGLDGNITIQPGNYIPSIPRQMLKLSVDYAVSPALSLNANLQAMSYAYARGNENNQHQADGSIYAGQARSAGYAIVNLGASYQATPQWQMLFQVNNLFNTNYATAAQLGANGFDANGRFVARPLGGSALSGYPLQQSGFLAPGTPRLFWLAARYTFGKTDLR
ncbi:TonB-dependent receptor [Undibacterium sp. SXout7W]|uniref:TonB-dependent receptor n=1 Tax=Undibacterium sp. SXout7W TaxID=3413049 RepID=UPI003BF3162E